MSQALTLPPLYFVTDHQFTGGRPQLQIIAAALRGGIRLIQYRDKILDDAAFAMEAAQVISLAHAYGALVLFNDRVALAARLGADGVHLGQDDLSPVAARKILGPKAIIGLSTHNAEEIQIAQTLPVSYINIGPIFPTATKDHSAYPALGADKVLELSRLTQHPWTTMGGIKAHHLPDLFLRGVTTVAVVTEISLAESVENRVRELLNVIHSAQKNF
jgi:thiamine-phosphate pyrophosphorylase